MGDVARGGGTKELRLTAVGGVLSADCVGVAARSGALGAGVAVCCERNERPGGARGPPTMVGVLSNCILLGAGAAFALRLKRRGCGNGVSDILCCLRRLAFLPMFAKTPPSARAGPSDDGDKFAAKPASPFPVGTTREV